MAKKKITVKDLLELTKYHEQRVVITFYAYGSIYGDSLDSGKTAEELLENMRYDCLNATVNSMFTEDNGFLCITASIV